MNMSTQVDWTLATIPQQQELATPEDLSSLSGCLVQIAPVVELHGPTDLVKVNTIIGRDPESDIELRDTSISREHAVILRDNNGFTILDQGSTNGTFVNDVRVDEAPLRGGDTIRIGNHILRFLQSADIEKQYHETVYSMMTTDGLTGACNKRFIVDFLEREILRSQRRGHHLSIAMIDIDHFKAINDTHGHLVGDEILRQFSKRIQRVLREDDLLARYGGEEFMVIQTETSPQVARQLAERIQAAIRNKPYATSVGELSITASIGIGALSTGDSTLESLVDRADQLLYQAKRDGRDRICG